MSKSRKRAFIILIIIAAVLVVLGIVTFCLYRHATELRFDYTNARATVASQQTEVDNRHIVNFPFFANSCYLADGDMMQLPLGEIGKETIPVYMSVNDVIRDYAYGLAGSYSGCVDSSYQVTNDGKTLTIAHHANMIDTTGDVVAVHKKFSFNIEGVSPTNLPQQII